VDIVGGRAKDKLQKYHICKAITEVLEWDPKKSQTVVNAILKTIVEALHRGEPVEILGFGTLLVRTKPPTRSAVPVRLKIPGEYVGDRTPPKLRCVEIRNIPARQYVWFQPSKVLLRLLNP